MSSSLTMNNPTQTQLVHYGIGINAPMSESEFYVAAEKQDKEVYDLINAKCALPVFQEFCNCLLPTVKKRYFASLVFDTRLTVDAIFEYYRKSCAPKTQNNSRSAYELYSIACMRRIFAKLILQQCEKGKIDVPFDVSEEFINLQIKMTQGGKLEDHYLEFLELLPKVDMPTIRVEVVRARFLAANALFCDRYFLKRDQQYELDSLFQVFVLELLDDKDPNRKSQYLNIPEFCKRFFETLPQAKHDWHSEGMNFFKDRKFEGVFERETFVHPTNDYINENRIEVCRIYADIYECVNNQTKNQEAMQKLLNLPPNVISEMVKEIFFSLSEKRLAVEHDEVTLFFNNLLESCVDNHKKIMLTILKMNAHFCLIEILLKQGNFALAMNDIVVHVFPFTEGPDLDLNCIYRQVINSWFWSCDKLLHLCSLGALGQN